MKRLGIGLILLFCLSSLAAAQGGSGYIFFAPGQLRGGGDSMFGVHFGGGFKVMSKSGLGFGAELGLAGPMDGFADDNFGLLSANGYYAFKTSNDKFSPFVTGGYSRAFGHDTGVNLGNFGVGFNYWIKDRTGVLVEFRDHIRRETDVTYQLWTFRFGIALK